VNVGWKKHLKLSAVSITQDYYLFWHTPPVTIWTGMHFKQLKYWNAQSSLRHSLGDTQSSFNKLYQKKCSSTDEIFTLDDLSLSFQKFPLIPVTLNNMKTKVYLNLLNTFNPLTMKCRLHYLKIQFVPHSKHFSSWL
jgi:hypothetical protein